MILHSLFIALYRTVLFVNNRRCQRIQRPFTDYGKGRGGRRSQTLERIPAGCSGRVCPIGLGWIFGGRANNGQEPHARRA